MHAVEGSDRAVVPVKLPNKEAFRASAEVVEGRARTKENVAELYTSPTQRGEVRLPGLRGAREVKFRFDPIIQGHSRNAVMPLVRICAGGGQQGPSLPRLS
jgi:hypothetical protein